MIENIKNNFILNTITPFFKQQPLKSYIVGGYLRDCLLGRESSDIDIVVDKGQANPCAKQLADSINGYFVELDSINNIYRVVFEDKINYVDIADCAGNSIEDDLKKLSELVNDPSANLIKTPNISASIPQLKAAITAITVWMPKPL